MDSDLEDIRERLERLGQQGNFDGALPLARRASELGDACDMANLGSVHERLGHVEEAERCYRAAINGGCADAMVDLAHLLVDRGEWPEAEHWYTRAADRGNTTAIFNLALHFSQNGDSRSAARWFAVAANLGHAKSMLNLARLLEENGNDAEAEAWLMRASELGNADATYNLALFKYERGALEEAESLYRQAATGGNASAYLNLGNLLQQSSRLDEALEVFLLGADANNAKAMISAAHLLWRQGALLQAEHWFFRAVEAGRLDAEDDLRQVRREIVREKRLESISFDTFGWPLVERAADWRRWQSGDFSLSERFFDVAPDIPTVDPQLIQSDLMRIQKMLKSQALNLDEHVSNRFSEYFPEVVPSEIKVLRVENFEIGVAKCLFIEGSRIFEGRNSLVASMVLLFADCFWSVVLELAIREKCSPFREIRIRHDALVDGVAPLSPRVIDVSDPEWDGMLPVGDDSLTRLTNMAKRVRDSIRLGDDLFALTPFGTEV